MQNSDFGINLNYTEVHSDEKMQKELLKGAKTLADSVGVTMGPRGNLVCIVGQDGLHPTKDGVTVAHSINLKDAIQNTAATIIKDNAKYTANAAGDGTTTCTILTYSIFKEGLKAVNNGSNPIILKRGMDKATELIVNNLNKMSLPIEDISDERLRQVVKISTNSDEQITNLIMTTLKEIGSVGKFSVRKTKQLKDSIKVIKGFYIKSGLVSTYFIQDKVRVVSELKDSRVLIMNEVFSNLEVASALIDYCYKKKFPLTIIAEDFDENIVTAFAKLVNNSNIEVALIKNPSYGSRRQLVSEDIAAYTGGTVFTGATDDDFNDMKVSKVTGNANENKVVFTEDEVVRLTEYLGRTESVISDINETIIVPSKVHDFSEAVDIKIGEVKAMIDVCDNDYEVEKHQDRLNSLIGNLGIINVGGQTESEMKERKDRIDDAVAAITSAREEGIVIGGGAALIKASADVIDTLTNDGLSGDELIGANILVKAVRGPLKRIVKNAGLNNTEIKHVVKSVLKSEPNQGYDAVSLEIKDMLELGIIDPTKVERVSLQNAVSGAATLLSCKVAIVKK